MDSKDLIMFMCALYDHLAESRRNVAGKRPRVINLPPILPHKTCGLMSSSVTQPSAPDTRKATGLQKFRNDLKDGRRSKTAETLCHLAI